MIARFALPLFLTIATPACKPNPHRIVDAVNAGDLPAAEAMIHTGVHPSWVEEGRALISLAADRGDAPMVELLARYGASPNVSDPPSFSGIRRGPLHLAASKGDLAVVEALLRAGAHPDADSRDGEEGPLALAAWKGHTAVIAALLTAGAKVDGTAQEGRGYPPLVIAADAGQTECAALLLLAGAKLEYRDILGMTALAAAAVHDHVETARFLLARGADPLAPNRAGYTPAAIALTRETKDMVRVFQAAGVTDFEGKPPPPLPPSGMGTVSVPLIQVQGQ